MGFSISVDSQGTVTTLTLVGELDLAARAAFDGPVERLVSAGERQLRVDLAALTFCDSIGLSSLIRAKRAAAEAGCSLYVVGATGPVADVLEITELAGYLGPPAGSPTRSVAPADKATNDA